MIVVNIVVVVVADVVVKKRQKNRLSDEGSAPYLHPQSDHKKLR